MKGGPMANSFALLALDDDGDRDRDDKSTAAASSSTEAAATTPSGTEGGKGKGKKKGKAQSNSSPRASNSPPHKAPSGEYKLPLVWIDLEMTGLDIEVDRILEVACIITDGKLTKLVEGPNLVVHQSKDCLDKMGEWCQEHHGTSGLTERVLKSELTEKEAEEQLIDFIKKHVGTYTPLLAGNSVYTDYLFLKKYMPELAGLFHHILVDVSSVKALCIRWFYGEYKRKPPKENKHRALDDIKESIQELKYYKENIFKEVKRK